MNALLLLLALIPSPATASKGGDPVLLWREWYLITQNGEAIGYFEETAERRPADKQIAITQKFVEKIAGGSEVYIGSVAEEARLKPVAFFVDRKGASAEQSHKTDARVKSRKIEITFKPASAAMAKSTEIVPLSSDLYLSSFVPMAVARSFRDKKMPAFTALVEDGPGMSVEIKKGAAELSKQEKKLAGESCRGVVLTMSGQAQEWWITKEGKACLMEVPSVGLKMALSTEAEAKKALGGLAGSPAGKGQ